MTTKQKKFLEKTFECLGISIEDVLLLTNLKEIIEENEHIKAENEELKKIVNQNTASIKEAIESIHNFIQDMQAGMFEEKEE